MRSLPYISVDRGNARKKRPRTIVKSRRAKPEMPEIFVRTKNERFPRYAHASIRVKAGRYAYLVWRDGGRIRNFYLGAKRNA
jgi:hypothetical protein